MNEIEEDKFQEGNNKDTKKSDVKQEIVRETRTVILDTVTPTTLLLDKRRTRTRSVGRPPTQGFLKETVLQKSSMDTNFDETDDSIKNNYTEKELSSVTQVINIMKQPKISSTDITTVAIDAHSSSWKTITLKKTTSDIKSSRVQDGPPPWLKEVQERKSHKLSLRGDEFLNKPKGHAVLEVNVSGIKNEAKEHFDKDNADKIKTVQAAENKMAQSSENSFLPAATTYKTNLPETSIDDKVLRKPKRHTIVEMNVSGNKNEVKKDFDGDHTDKIQTVENKTAQLNEKNLLPTATVYKTHLTQSSRSGELLKKPERHSVGEMNVLEIKNEVKEHFDGDRIDTTKTVKTAENKTAQLNEKNSLPAATSLKSNLTRISRRYTVNTDFDHYVENIKSVDIKSGNEKIPPIKLVDDIKPKNLESVVEKITIFIDQSKNSQKKIQKDFRTLESTINGEFEKHIEKLEEIKNFLTSTDKK